jgi:DNA-binding PucR family transcriptional regulator
MSREHVGMTGQGFGEQGRGDSRGIATVRELVEVPALHLTLVAGAAGLDRPVRWAHAIELVDPRPYLVNHELVLTMGSVLGDPEACRAFVEAVTERDASGIGFGCGNYQPAAPPALREACDRAGLPLLEVPVDVPFMAITEELAERMAARRADRDRRALRRETRLLDLLSEGRGLDAIAWSVARELGATIVVADPDGNPEAIAEAGPPVPDALGVVARAVAAIRAGQRWAVAADEAIRSDVVPVRHRQEIIGWLCRIGPSHGARDDGVLHEVAQIVSIELATRAQERNHDRAAVGRLLEIIRSGVADPIIMADRLAEARLDQARIFASVWSIDAAEALRRAVPRALVGRLENRLAVIADERERLERLAADQGLACGLGSAGDAANLSRSLAEADEAYRVAAGRGGVVGWHELASLSTLLGQQPADRLDVFVNQLIVPLVEYDAAHGAELLPTLRVFLEAGGIVASAARLHLHVNSLRHRLGRIRTITGRDPLTFLDRAAFYIGLRTWDARHGMDVQREDLNIIVPDD